MQPKPTKKDPDAQRGISIPRLEIQALYLLARTVSRTGPSWLSQPTESWNTSEFIYDPTAPKVDAPDDQVIVSQLLSKIK